AVHAVAEDLAANGVTLRPEVLDGHVVLGPDPAVAVAVEEDLAGDLGPVRGGGVPEAAVEEDGGTGLREDRDGAVGLANPIRRTFQGILEVAGRDHPEVAAVRDAGVGKEIGDLEGEPGARMALDLDVDAPAVL